MCRKIHTLLKFRIQEQRARELALQVATRPLSHLQVTQMAARQTAREPEL